MPVLISPPNFAIIIPYSNNMAVKHFSNKRPMNYTDPVYETIQQKPEVFTEWRLSPATASGDQQEKESDIPDADWKREHPRLEIDGT